VGDIFRGWAKAKNGDLTQGISLLRSGSTAFRATGAEVYVPHHTALLAGAYEIAGQIDEAVTLLDDALQMVQTTGERWSAAELNKQKASYCCDNGISRPPSNCIAKPCIAAEQEAKLWELRAAASLARLRRDQGRCAEARELLAPLRLVHRRIRHPDLKTAKALLDELDRGHVM
jgi:predicted ATPase